jgi:hypothetical protein
MMDIERFKTAMAAHFLDREYVPYLKTSNPIHAWQAYRIARKCGVPLPAWVLDYFDRCAEKVIIATDNTQIAQAVELAQKGGGASKTRQAKKNARNFDIVSRFLSLKERPTHDEIRASAAEAPKAVRTAVDAMLRDAIDVRDNDTSLMQQVGEEFDLSADSVRDIIYDLIPSTRI